MRYLKIVLIAAFILTSASCKKNSEPSFDPLTEFLTAPGSWRVSVLLVGIVDKASEFEGYAFVFTKDGKVTATNQDTVVSGTWKSAFTKAPPNSTTERDVATLTLSFPFSEKFDMITKAWRSWDVRVETVIFNDGEFVIEKN